MKVIDLLNKIANGELEHNTKFKIISPDTEFICRYDKDICQIMVIGDYEFTYMIDFMRILNYKVEIIEDKKIEKIDLSDWIEITTKGDLEEETFTKIFNKNATTFVNKINEIIDYINRSNDE